MKITDYNVKNIVFYSNAHNGDIHICRTYVADIINKLPNYTYYFKQLDSKISSFILEDIPTITKFTPELALSSVVSMSLDETTQTLYINTWVGQDNYVHFGTLPSQPANHVSFHVLRSVFSSIYDFLGIDLFNSVHSYLPIINFENIDISEVDALLNKIPPNHKRILVCNNDVKSDQSLNFDFDMVFNSLISASNCVFFFTNPTTITHPYVYDLGDYVAFPNLNKIAYLSTHCDIIVGRSSGPYTFSILSENVHNPNKTFVCFANARNLAVGLNEGEHSCDVVWTNQYDILTMQQLIRNIL
jgi:hypothetical protein